MFKIISSWTKTSPSIIVLKSLLQVDPTCPAELEALLAADCQKPIHSKVHQHSTTHSIPEAKQQGAEGTELVTIVGTLVGVLAASATVIATIFIGCVLFHRAKRPKNQHHWWVIVIIFTLTVLFEVTSFMLAPNPHSISLMTNTLQ